jgi:hypothetical protein
MGGMHWVFRGEELPVREKVVARFRLRARPRSGHGEPANNGARVVVAAKVMETLVQRNNKGRRMGALWSSCLRASGEEGLEARHIGASRGGARATQSRGASGKSGARQGNVERGLWWVVVGRPGGVGTGRAQ